MPNELQWEIFKKSLEATIEEGIELTKGQINENSIIKLERFKSIAWETVDNSYYDYYGFFDKPIFGITNQPLETDRFMENSHTPRLRPSFAVRLCCPSFRLDCVWNYHDRKSLEL